MTKNSTPRIVFMGSPAFVIPVLEKLHQNFDVVGVFSQPPRPSGRGQKLTPTPVHKAAEDMGLSVFTPEKLKGEAFDALAALKPDFICVAAYGLILRQNVLDLAPCINIHPSTLPRWRGAAPIHHTLLNGATELDICLMEMERGLDTGPIFNRTVLPIGPNDTTGNLLDKSFKIGGGDLVNLIQNWPQEAIPQGEDGTTYAHKLEAADRVVDFKNSAQNVHNQIRALNPFPMATCSFEGETWKLYTSVQTTETSNEKAGTIIAADKDGLAVVCGDSKVLKLTTLQRPGKRAQSAAEFCNGLDSPIGKVLNSCAE